MNDHRQGRGDESCRMASRAALGLPPGDCWLDRNAGWLGPLLIVIAMSVGMLMPLVNL